MSESGKTTRRRPNWDAVERAFRLGHLTQTEIAELHGVSKQAVSARAKKFGWKRDLTDAVRATTRAVVIAQTVAEAVDRAGQQLTDEVAAAAQVNAEVIGRHRRFSGRLYALQEHLAQELAELDAAAERARLAVGKLVEGCSDDDRAALQAIAKPILADLAKAADLSYRIDAYDALTRAAERVQRMERQCYGLDDQPQEHDESFEALLSKAEEYRRRDGRDARQATDQRALTGIS